MLDRFMKKYFLHIVLILFAATALLMFMGLAIHVWKELVLC